MQQYFSVSKLSIMKNKFIKLLDSMPRLLLQITAIGFIIFYLTGCSCQQYCATYSGLNKFGCELACAQQSSSIKKTTTAADSVATVGNTIPTKKAPGQIEGPLPGEFYATTITVGPNLNFKSSNEEYAGGYGKHEPGVGFHFGVGTVLPFNQHWAIAPSLRFTQKNASEKFGYNIPGQGSMEFKDKYTYNYLGASILAQYRVSKNVSLVAGPEVNYLIGSKVKSSEGEKLSLTKSSTKVGLDLIAGIKYEIPSANRRSRWGIQLMYDHRISRLNKKKDEDGNDVPAYRMKSLHLGVAYNICGCGK